MPDHCAARRSDSVTNGKADFASRFLNQFILVSWTASS